MNTEQTLAWLKDVSELALTEARGGNTALANKLGQNPAFQYYFNNVHTRPTMTPEQFARQFPTYVQQADAMREEYEAMEKVSDHDERLNALETKVEKGLKDLKKELRAVLAELKEQKTQAVEAVEPEADEAEEDEIDEADDEGGA